MKPNEPHHANIDLVDAFSFPHSGEYTIEYTRPLIYFTKEGMAQHGEESPLPYTPKQHDYQPLDLIATYQRLAKQHPHIAVNNADTSFVMLC